MEKHDLPATFTFTGAISHGLFWKSTPWTESPFQSGTTQPGGKLLRPRHQIKTAAAKNLNTQQTYFAKIQANCVRKDFLKGGIVKLKFHSFSQLLVANGPSQRSTEDSHTPVTPQAPRQTRHRVWESVACTISSAKVTVSSLQRPVFPVPFP